MMGFLASILGSIVNIMAIYEQLWSTSEWCSKFSLWDFLLLGKHADSRRERVTQGPKTCFI